MSDQKWGFGNPKDSKPFGISYVGTGEGKQSVELVFGENPHSRQDNTIYARYPDGDIYSFSGHRYYERVEIETYNYGKIKWGEGGIRKHGRYKILFNDRVVYSDNLREMDYMLKKVQWDIVELREHVAMYDLMHDTLIGRKVFYKDVPAVVDRILEDTGEIVIKPEDGYLFYPSVYSLDKDDCSDLEYEWDSWMHDYSEYTRVNLLEDHNVWWFRGEKDMEVLEFVNRKKNEKTT